MSGAASPDSPRSAAPQKPAPGRAAQRPWRTEGVPKAPPDKKPDWKNLALWGLVYLALFGLLTFQDRLKGPAAVPYTEFKSQVATKNVAEVFGVVTTGSESDLEMVTRVARSMVGRWGMSERVGRLSVLPVAGDPRMAGVSDALLGAVDQEVRRITDECYADAKRLLRENRAKLDSIAAQLLARESLDEPGVYAAAGIPLRGLPPEVAG